ncbi:hypothetical protein [Undibacterium danionis]|uniref:Uncharacterized protein n=1 Tax=Undibacterium danionis TaxID=1812100 RepID=A0ABV6IC79_9BURK
MTLFSPNLRVTLFHSLIAMKATQFPEIRVKAVMRLSEWITSELGKKIIADF